MFNTDDEHDYDRDEEEEDADDSQNNDSDDQDEDDSYNDQDEDSDDSDDSDEDDDKPVTRKELREMLQKNSNKQNANRRVQSKNHKNDRGNRNNSQSSKTDERIANLEKAQRQSALIEAKRNFGYENNLSPKQVDVVFTMTKRPTKKFLETPYVKAALETIGKQSNVRDNTPSGSGRGSFRNQSGKTWDKMDATEKQQNLAERRRAILDSKR